MQNDGQLPPGMISGGENGGTNINVIESIVESFNYQVNDEKRKQKVCVHWLK